MNEKMDRAVLLDLLGEVEVDGNHTQRSLAARLGIALGSHWDCIGIDQRLSQTGRS